MSDELVIVEETRSAPDPMHILQLAVSQGADVDKLAKLMELQERWQANQAKSAFTKAMAAFKADPPKVLKDKRVSFKTNSGTTEYTHASLGKLCDAVTSGLSKYGLSHSWSVEQDKGLITVTCVLTHEAGHSEKVSMSGMADTSGSKNPIQAVGSAVTYLQRYTLLSATGLAAEDDDGTAAHERNKPERGSFHDPAQKTPAADPVAWQELYPDGWNKMEAKDGRLYGDIHAETDGDRELGKLWLADMNNPALCAWAADYASKGFARLQLKWPEVQQAVKGLPDEFMDLTPVGLRALAKFIQSQQKK